MAKTQTVGGRFEGFTPGGLRLLAGLARNNDRAWFAPRKARIAAELLEPMAALVDDATAALADARIGLRGDRKQSIFRIYRDVRFGHDKSPYRTNLAAYLSYDGGRHTQGGVYVQIGARASHLAAVFRRIPPPMLARWRHEMAERPERFERVLAALRARGLALDGPQDRDDSLARMPRGFEDCADGTLGPYFRLRHFIAHRGLAQRDVTTRAVVGEIVRFARDAKPLLDFGWALD